MVKDARETKHTILIVDDDQALAEMLSIVLESSGFSSVRCSDGLSAVEMVTAIRPDLILLDVMLPGLDGIGVAEAVRKGSDVPIIMLTAKTDTVDVVKGLQAGADDYVSKPFKAAELLARIHARLRSVPLGGVRDASGAIVENHIERGPIVMDREHHTVVKHGRALHLTPVEFDLLFDLASHYGQALSRADLLKQVWGYESSGDTRLVNVHIQRLRSKVEDDPEHPSIIRTVRGIGYTFDPEYDVDTATNGTVI